MSAYVKRLADYDIERLTEAVDAMFTASAFYGRIKPHMTVILKPNLVMRSAPEEAIITHPNVTAAVAICLLFQFASQRDALLTLFERDVLIHLRKALCGVRHACGRRTSGQRIGAHPIFRDIGSVKIFDAHKILRARLTAFG